MICNRKAFVRATGCPQISVDISFPDLSYCDDPEYINPKLCDACDPNMLPQPDINFPGAQKCMEFNLTFSVLDPDATIVSATYTVGSNCFSASIVIPIRLPCFRKILTRSSGRNNGTSLLLTVRSSGCYITARFSSAFSLKNPTGYMARIRKCIIPECLNISITPIVVDYGTHDADNIGYAVVNLDSNLKLNDINLMFPLMCDLPPEFAKESTQGAIVSLKWQWNKEKLWQSTVAFPKDLCELRAIAVHGPGMRAWCTNGVYHVYASFTRFKKPDMDLFIGHKGPTGPRGNDGHVGRDASQGDASFCPIDGVFCDGFDVGECDKDEDKCKCNKEIIELDCPFNRYWEIEVEGLNYHNMYFTSDGYLIASVERGKFMAWNTCPGVVYREVVWSARPKVEIRAPVGIPVVESDI